MTLRRKQCYCYLVREHKKEGNASFWAEWSCCLRNSPGIVWSERLSYYVFFFYFYFEDTVVWSTLNPVPCGRQLINLPGHYQVLNTEKNMSFWTEYSVSQADPEPASLPLTWLWALQWLGDLWSMVTNRWFLLHIQVNFDCSCISLPIEFWTCCWYVRGESWVSFVFTPLPASIQFLLQTLNLSEIWFHFSI